MSRTDWNSLEKAIELAGATKNSSIDLREMRGEAGYGSLVNTLTKIGHSILTERRSLSGRIKFTFFPERLLMWSLRRNPIFGALINEFKQGLKEIYHNSESQKFREGIEGIFKSIGEPIGEPVQPAEISTEQERNFRNLRGNAYISTDDSIAQVRSFLHGHGDVRSGGEVPEIRRQVFDELNISDVRGIQELTREHLQECVNGNKPMVVIEGGNALLIRKNEKGALEITKFTTQPKTLTTHGGIQMDSGDYVNAFQLFNLKHKFDPNDPASSLESIRADLREICDGKGQPKEVPQEQMLLMKSAGQNPTNLDFELLQLLQYATKGNQSQEALVARFETDRYVAHLDNIKEKMARESGPLLEQHIVALNALGRDIQQRILSLQASGKISPELASECLSKVSNVLTRPETGSANPAATAQSHKDNRAVSLGKANTTYTQNSALQTSQGCNIQVCDDVPTFLQQAGLNKEGSACSARLIMGFASARKFEEFLSNHQGTLDSLRGKNEGETLENISNFFRMAVAYTEYNKRNGIAVPKDKQEIYDNLIKLGAAIYKKYGKECGIDKAQYEVAGGLLVHAHWSEEIRDALFNGNKTIENYQDAEPLLSSLNEDAKSEFFTTARGVEDSGQKLNMRRKAAGNGFAYMLLSLAENAKDGIAFDRQSDMKPAVIKNVSFGEQLQSDFKEICGFLNDNPQGKIAKSKYAKRFPFLEHCHLPPGGNALQKTEAMLSWLQTSGNVSVFNNLGMQRMFCKLLCGDANNPQALAGALKDRATRKQFVGIANQFFETASKNLPNPVQTEEDMQKYKLYMSLYIQLNGIVKTAGGPELKNNAFSQKISLAGMANEELGFACVLCQKMIQKEKLTPDEVLKCTDPKMMIWPEMAGASDTLLERDPEDSSGIKNMFEGVPLEALRGFITDQVSKLTEDEFQRIGQQYAQQRGYEDSQVTVDVGNKLITIKDQDGNVKVNIDLNNFLCLIDGTHPEEHVKTKSDEHPIFTKLGIDATNIRSRVKIEGDVSTVDGKITIDNLTNKVIMNGKVLVAPKTLPPGQKPTETDRMLAHFLPFAEETDAACEKVYLYDPMSLDKPVFILKNGKLYTSDDNECEYKSASFGYGGGSEFFHDPRLKMLSPKGETKTGILETIDPDTNEVLSYMMPEVHYNNQILQFNRHADGELHLASNEQYVLSEPPMPNPLANSKSNYICLRDKDKPSSYKFILVNNKSLIDSSSIDNAVRQKVPILNQDVLEIGFTPSEGFSLGSSNYQAAGILLVGKLFEAGENKQALDILNKISMRDVVAGRNNALLQLVFRSLVADASKGNVLKIKKDLTIEGKLATFKIITLLLESNPYNFRNLLLDKGPDGAVVFESSFNLIMQISSLYQSLVDARENSTMEVNLSKENELVIVEEIIGAMSQVLAAAPALQMLMKVTPEKVILNQLPEYGLLKLFEQKHRALVGELGAPSNVKHLTNAAQDSKDHEIVHYQPGGKRSFEKASKFSSALPTRNTEMLARLRQEARATSQLQGSSNVERRKIFSQKCCRSDAAINGDQELSPRQKADYIAFRNAMDFPQFPDGDDENDIIISSIATVYASEIEGFIRSQAPESKHSEALDGENNVRQSIMGGILRPVKASQAGAQADPERDIYDTYKTNLLLDVVQWDEKAIQSNEALTKNDKQLILAFKKKHMAAIHTPEFREQHKLELLDLAKAIGGQGKTFLSNNRQGIAQYESTAERELGRYNEEMSLAGSQDLRASALGELYEINAESFVKAEGEGKSPIESAIDDIAAQIETASKEKTDIENKLKEKFSKCSQTMDNLRKANLAKKLELEDLSDVRKALVCAPSDPNGDWSKSIKILQDVNPDYTDTECKEIVNLTRQLLQTSTAIESMKQMKIAAENVQNKGRALMDASESFPAHGATNLTSGQKDFLLAKNQLLTAYESVRTYDPRTDMEALVFENIVGLRVRGAQASIIRNVTAQLQANEANNEATGITFQLMMGGGKTSVILSQLAHSISLQHKTPLFVCHPSQYTAMLGNLRSFQESRYSQEVISVDESKSDLQDASKLSGILRKIKRANDGGGCLVIQAPTLRAIKLEFIRTSRLAIESKNPEAMARAKQLANILSEVKENCVQLLDEVDLNLDISKSVNFPGGGRKALASSQVDVIASMLDVVTEDPELYDAFCSDKFGMEKDGQTPVGIFKEKIIARCFERIQTLDGSITREDFEKFMLGTEEPSAAFKKAWEGIKGSGQEAEKIALQKGMLSIADSAAKKEYNRHYGFREDGAVIPYQGVGTPSSGEFGNVYEQAYYFFAAVLHNGIQESQMTSLVEMYTNGSLSPSLVEKLESGLNEIGLKLSDLKKMSDAQRNAAIHKTTKQLNANKKSKNFMSFAKMLATNTIKYNSELLECDAVSMVDMSKTTIGCTGTPWNMQTYHSAFQGDDKAILDLGTEGKILQKWKKDFQIGASKILTPAAATVSGILDAHKAAHAENSGNLRALVDAGGVLKDKANEEVARDILDYYKDDPSVEYVIYLGKTMAGEESFFVMKQSDRDNPVPIPNTELKTIEQVVGEGNIGKAFTYFDELRCTGCDIPLDKNARAVLTVNPDTTPIRTALQGILRARKFLDSQTVDLCIPKELIPPGVDLNNDNSLEGMTKICGYCIENQSAMLAKQTYKSYKAQIANCLKGILFERLHEIISKHDGQKISKQEQKIMDLCEKFIYSPFEADPLVLFGGFTSEQNAYEALQNDYESIRAKINKADKSIAREFQVRAQKVLDQGKEVLNFKVQAGAIDTGTEVEAEQEQEQDQEQEQVTEDSGKVVEEKSWAVLNPRVSADGDAPATAQPAEGGQATDAAPQAQKSLEDKAKGTMDDLQSEDFTEGATLESVLKSRMEGTGKVVDLVDQRLQAAARKNELSDRELLIVLNERHNNEEDQTGESRSLLEDNGSLLIDKTKARILATAPSFASLISSEEATAPRILSANECIPSKSDQHVFDANVQITANLAQNLEGVNWMDDSQRKDAQFALVYRSDDGAFKTLFLSDQDSQEIGKAMADLNVRDCWMFNAAGIPTSTNPLPITGEDILAAGRKAATDLAILYGNFHHLNSTDGNRQALQEHIASSPEAKKNFLERVQALQPREYDNALEFLRAA